MLICLFLVLILGVGWLGLELLVEGLGTQLTVQLCSNLSKNPPEDFYSAIMLMLPLTSFYNFLIFKSNNLYKAYEIEELLYQYLIQYIEKTKIKYWEYVTNVLTWDKDQLKYFKIKTK